MRIISTGFARCASMALTNFMSGLGVHSWHEPCSYVGGIDHWLERAPYDVKQYPLDHPPPSVVEYCDLWPHARDMRAHDEYFVADWSLGLIIYELSRRLPDITWLITLRKPVDQINSLMCYRHRKDIDLFLDKWIEYHLFLLRQLQRMDNAVCLLEFDRLVTGQYDYWLRDLCGLKAIMPVDTRWLWSKKVNSAGQYENVSIGSFLYVCTAIQNAIRNECEVV